MITLEHVSKTFIGRHGDVHALQDVSLKIQEKEIYGIIGFSGAGKSTLIRCMNLLERPTSGKIHINGYELLQLSEKDLREVRKKIGMIFQHFNLMPNRNVYQNIAFPLKHARLSKNERDQKIMSLLELVGLTDKQYAYPSQLSGGQKQRVAIARALANDPEILLCDEATSALDPQTTKNILRLLKTVNEKLGITIVLITHEMAVIKDICHRVAVMENGKVAEEGSVLNVFTQPQKSITKKFIESTSNIHQIYEMMEQNAALTSLQQGQRLVKLNYDDVNTNKALISEISRRYQIDINIIYGNVEIIQQVPLGDLIVIISGESKQITQALLYLCDHKINVEVMKAC